MKLICLFIPSTICVGLAAALAFNHVEGWGWFLFMAFVLCPGLLYSAHFENEKKK